MEPGWESRTDPRHSSCFKSPAKDIAQPHMASCPLLAFHLRRLLRLDLEDAKGMGEIQMNSYCKQSSSLHVPLLTLCRLSPHLHPSQEGTSGKAPLHFAVELHDVTSVKLLLSRGAKVDSAMFNGCTPLHLAVGRRDATIANILCQSGADTMLRNMEDETALDLANGNDDVSEVEACISKG